MPRSLLCLCCPWLNRVQHVPDSDVGATRAVVSSSWGAITPLGAAGRPLAPRGHSVALPLGDSPDLDGLPAHVRVPPQVPCCGRLINSELLLDSERPRTPEEHRGQRLCISPSSSTVSHPRPRRACSWSRWTLGRPAPAPCPTSSSPSARTAPLTPVSVCVRKLCVTAREGAARCWPRVQDVGEWAASPPRRPPSQPCPTPLRACPRPGLVPSKSWVWPFHL